MKFLVFNACVLSALASVTLHAENLVVNGDFETGEGTAFYASPPWYNRGTGLNQGTGARSDGGEVIAGTYSAIVNDRFDLASGKLGGLAHTQKTDYTIQEGDSFILSYQWRPADQYWQKATDTIRFVLYATANDKAGGEVVWSSEWTSDFFKPKPGGAMLVSETTDAVNADAVGRTLYVMFYGLDTNDSGTGTVHWARVDNIDVQVLKK